MPYDGLITHKICEELNNILLLGKIDKIIQPNKDDVLLFIRNCGATYKLMLSSNAQNAGTYITKSKNTESPLKPFNFCMVLRKYLSGAKLINIAQPNNDRILNFTFENSNELGDKEIRILIIEMMGKYSNIILINQNNLIIDSLKHIDFEISRIREVMPGRTYFLPPNQDKSDPFKINENDYDNMIKSGCTLSSKLIGISSLVSKELENIDFKSFSNFINSDISPIVFLDDKDEPADFYFTNLKTYSFRNKTFSSLCDAIDFFFSYKCEHQKLENQKQLLASIISHLVSKTEKKLEIVNNKLETTKNMEDLRIMGELLSANLYKIKPYSSEAILDNYYTDSQIKIELNPNLTPAQNTQKIFKKYTKLKNTFASCCCQKELLLADVSYFESVFFEIYTQDYIDDLEEIKLELISQGLIKEQNKKQKQIQSKPLTFYFDNCEILVGKNNIQNDNLTFHIASKKDIWFHVKNAPGSHTVLRTNNQPATQDILEKSASLAAFHSKLKNSPKVEVDYTLVKNVKKIPGAKPGMVIYDNYKTIYINPSINL